MSTDSSPAQPRSDRPTSAQTLGLPYASRAGALEGLVIVEIAGTVAAEMAGGLLADLGAAVVKIEPPGGSPLRRLGPAIPGEEDSLHFQSENRGKYSVESTFATLATEPWFGRLLARAEISSCRS